MASADSSLAPAVSIIIPCYKHAGYLPGCIESIVNQTYTDWECIIVDDGSPDDTSAVAQALIERYPARKIRLLRQVNQGLGQTRNNGIRASSGRYILPLDADDLLAPTMLEATVGLLERSPELSVAYTDVQLFGLKTDIWQTGRFELDAEMQDNQLPYCSLYRRGVWDAVGGYDPTRRLSHEDWEFWLHAMRRGFRGDKVAQPLFRYRTAAQSMVTECNAQRPKMIGIIVLNHPGLFEPAKEDAAWRILGAEANPVLGRTFAPTVSVIVSTRNRPQALERALRSVLAQTLQDFEILVVNDGGESVDALIASIDHGNKIQSLRLARARGAAGARNFGLRAARGRYIAYLDDYDCYRREHLQTLVDALSDGKSQAAYSDALSLESQLEAGDAGIEGQPLRTGTFDAVRMLAEPYIPLSCLLHERRCLIELGANGELGGFDESLGALESWDLCLRLGLRYSFAYVQRPTCMLGRSDNAAAEPLQRLTANVIRAKQRKAARSRKDARAAAYRERMKPVTALIGAGKNAEALEQMARVVLADPTYAEGYNDLAVIDYSAGRYRQAGEAIQRSLELDPNNATALETQAAIRTALAGAAGPLKQSEENRSVGSSSRYQELLPQIETMVNAADYPRAISALEAFISACSDSAEAHNDLAVVLNGAGRQQDALMHAQRAIALAPNTPEIACTLAMIQLSRGDVEGAARTIEPALSGHPQNANLLTVAREISKAAPARISAPAARAADKSTMRANRSPILALAFSRDRQMQLDGTLRSLQLHWREAENADIKVLTKATTDGHRALYRRLGQEHPRVELITETDFRAQLLGLLGLYEQVLFLVDDNIVVRPFSLAEASNALRMDPQLLGVSLRLGSNTTSCYTMRAEQRVPPMASAYGLKRFRWVGSQHDFGYPLEVSSSLYRAADMHALISQLAFRNPNELEARMAERAVSYAATQPDLLCFEQSVTFCNPVNIVQTTYRDNRAGNADELSPAALARRYAEGERIRVEAYRGVVPNGCHQEVPLAFEQTSIVGTGAVVETPARVVSELQSA